MGFFKSILDPVKNIIGDITGSNDAADAQQAALNRALSDLSEAGSQVEERLMPISDIAVPTIEKLQGLISGTEDFTPSPGYEFRLGEGLRGIQAMASAGGALNSGGTLKALMRYGQDYATSEFDNQINRLTGLYQLATPYYSAYTDLPLSLAQERNPLFLEQGNVEAAKATAPFNTIMDIGKMIAGASGGGGV